jgi:L,D-peptidoglycan transpeptidase YkuD (ErfK/YbiS/YcfS/YnhG family)
MARDFTEVPGFFMRHAGKPRGALFPAGALLLLFVTCATHGAILASMNIPDSTSQIILVVAPTMDSPYGTMQLFERTGGSWTQSGPDAKVSLGRNGLAWGNGLPAGGGKGPVKREGDGRSPAGAFALGDVFGYDPIPPHGTRMSYRRAGQDDYFIDDVASPDYNSWIALSPGEDPDSLWKSYERMRRPDGLYEIGIIVKHNMDPVVAGNGSAIFIHVWREEGVSTTGCTALSRENLLSLLTWLDPSRNPLLIQLPEAHLGSFRFESFAPD